MDCTIPMCGQVQVALAGISVLYTLKIKDVGGGGRNNKDQYEAGTE